MKRLNTYISVMIVVSIVLGCLSHNWTAAANAGIALLLNYDLRRYVVVHKGK